MVTDYVIEIIGKRIAGDIVWSSDIGASLRKWRNIFRVSQSELARALGVATSVINNYEKNKRSPGARFVKKYVDALIKIDAERGWVVIKDLMRGININPLAIIDIGEYDYPVKLDEVVTVVKGVLVNSVFQIRPLYGYTVIDSINAIQLLSGNEFIQIMGATSERILVFTKVSTGRSPMIAIRVAPIKPAAVIFHGSKRIDPLAIVLADKESIPLILSTASNIDELTKSLRELKYRVSY